MTKEEVIQMINSMEKLKESREGLVQLIELAANAPNPEHLAEAAAVIQELKGIYDMLNAR